MRLPRGGESNDTETYDKDLGLATTGFEPDTPRSGVADFYIWRVPLPARLWDRFGDCGTAFQQWAPSHGCGI